MANNIKLNENVQRLQVDWNGKKKQKKLKAVAAPIIFRKTIATESFWQIDLYQTEK